MLLIRRLLKSRSFVASRFSSFSLSKPSISSVSNGNIFFNESKQGRTDFRSSSSGWRGTTQPLRGFSTDEESEKTPAPPALPPTPAQQLADATARGVGQVIFLNSPKSGQILGLALFLGDPFLATMAAIGTVTATSTAKAAGLDKGSIESGLLGYNGCLVGCASSVFGAPSVLAATTATVVGAAATPFVASSLKEAMGGVPQWTFAFNAVALTSFLKMRPLLPPPPEEAVVAAAVTVAKGSMFGKVLASPLTGVSQIFVVESPLSGAIILGGIGSYSPLLAVHALGGSTMGTLVGALSGAPLEEIAMGLYGFNSALTSMAVGVFFVHSTPSVLLSAGGAAATASLFGAMKTVFGAYGSPCLTLPFCITMSACYLLQKHVPGLVLASNPHSPEKNE